MLTIAVDGYASSGKGSVCKMLADKLNIMHLDTGAMYRAVGLYIFENNIDPHDEGLVSSELPNINVKVKHVENRQVTYLNDEDVSKKIRNNKVSNICSIISQYISVREHIIMIQREIADNYDVIMEGRDITSHVLPNAQFKFMLSASVDVRAERRYKELIDLGQSVTFEQIKEELIERDRRDTQRKIAPLILTEGTIFIDNSDMTIEEEVELMYNIVKGEE